MPSYLLQYRPVRLEMPADPTDEESRIVGDHFLFVKSLFEAGTISYVGRTLTAPHIGIAVFEAADNDAARAIMAADPVVKQNVMTATVQPFSVVFR
jgi:uncharacterized protein YciI